ncbi:ABC transporter substrate-binding protein [Paraglaciecola sp. L3A3]|uniref:substrate-binding periplasmic protein n=1 Tax=Paraglaciecola sp. L3A3 TaxID=2686358 RepID=UPI00131C4BDD|nr:transporter substrate-binding domain-containing protein [Paraglaciecola sp. L3A3]
MLIPYAKRLHKGLISILLICITSGVFKAASANSVTLKLAATDWCPYTCENNISKKGIAYDYIQFLFKQKNIALDVSSYPWARAIRQVEKGKLHGLLTAVHSESPNLLFTQSAMMSYQMCFYGKEGSKWQYAGEHSLKDIRLGVISEYGYGQPVDQYLANKRSQYNVVKLSSNQALQQLISLVEAERIDVLIEDKNVMNWYFKNSKQNSLNKLGCLAEESLYLAMSPKVSWSEDVIDFLNKEFQKETNQQWLLEYAQVYYQ